MRASHPTLLLLALAATLSAGCSTSRSDPVLRGHYVWGAEVNTFRPCGSTDVYWVNAADTARFRLVRVYEELTIRPYEPVFVELAGSVGEVPSTLKDGFPGDYDGLISISWLGKIQPASPGDCE